MSVFHACKLYILPGLFSLFLIIVFFFTFPECSEQRLGASSFAISPAGHWQGRLPAAGQLGPRLLPRPPPPRQPRPPTPARPGCGIAASATPPGGTVRGVWQQGTSRASTIPSSTGQPDWRERYKLLEFSFTTDGAADLLDMLALRQSLTLMEHTRMVSTANITWN